MILKEIKGDVYRTTYGHLWTFCLEISCLVDYFALILHYFTSIHQVLQNFTVLKLESRKA